MAGEESSSSGFKVVDRLLFAADGSRKEDVVAEEKKVEAAPVGDRSRVLDPQDEPRSQYDDDASGFETLVSYLSTTAMFQLGLIPRAVGGAHPCGHAQRQAHHRPAGNLERKDPRQSPAGESQLLDDVLYDLRMSFVEMQKRQARKSK